jgi:hypothetical protein
MVCGCRKDKSNQQTSAQTAQTVTGFGDGDGVAAAQESVRNSIANTTRGVRRG